VDDCTHKWSEEVKKIMPAAVLNPLPALKSFAQFHILIHIWSFQDTRQPTIQDFGNILLPESWHLLPAALDLQRI
jgi:hypothetical protein